MKTLILATFSLTALVALSGCGGPTGGTPAGDPPGTFTFTGIIPNWGTAPGTIYAGSGGTTLGNAPILQGQFTLKVAPPVPTTPAATLASCSTGEIVQETSVVAVPTTVKAAVMTLTLNNDPQKVFYQADFPVPNQHYRFSFIYADQAGSLKGQLACAYGDLGTIHFRYVNYNLNLIKGWNTVMTEIQDSYPDRSQTLTVSVPSPSTPFYKSF